MARFAGGVILLIIGIWCFTTFPFDLPADLITKCVAGILFSFFGILLLICGLQKKHTAMTVSGAILLAFSIFTAMGTDSAAECIACGILLGIGMALLICGLKGTYL